MPPVTLRRTEGPTVLAPAGARTVLDPAPGAGVLVLEVVGGHLTWDLFDESGPPAAVLDDPDAAQDWVWALYGEPVALALADGAAGPLDAAPGDPARAAAARRLAYAHWAARWWPASTLDGIAALDPALLDAEIAELTAACDPLVDGADALEYAEPAEAPAAAPGRADDYALAAGDAGTGGVVLRRGVTGWAWHRCPPGLVDASERAVTWETLRQKGSGVLRVEAVAAPHAVPREVPAHLRPWVRVGTRTAPLAPAVDRWAATVAVPDGTADPAPELYVPGIGSGAVESGAERERIRGLARTRLARAATDPAPALRAEIAAAADDSDF